MQAGGESIIEIEVLDIGPLTKMGENKPPEIIEIDIKDKKNAPKKIDPVEKAKKSKDLIEDRVFMARLAEQACCYEDMLEYLTEILDEKT